jgi:prolyl-tRNA editing enzyme YbaK/EbsC (Cys-tRNA(Pro) deacylase)
MTSSSVERVQDALRKRGLQAEVLELSSSTRTAVDAAATLGCEVAQIAKSLVFVSADGRHVLVIASGINRVDEKKLAALFGQSLKRASADQVREMSGFAIGGVPPLAHKQEPAAVFVDEDLLAHEVIWAAAGSPNAVVRLTGEELVAISGGTVAPTK